MCYSFYDRHIAPRLMHLRYRTDEFALMRERVIPRAQGIVVEIGFGSGLNLPHYDPRKVDLLIGIEPDQAMMQLARDPLATTPFPTLLRQGVGECLMLDDAIADTVVVTYALSAIGEPDKALKEIRRILKPGGQLLFCEHGPAYGRRARLQRVLSAAWGKLFGGRNLTRDPIVTIEAAGFAIADVAAKRFPFSQMLFGMHYAGAARAWTCVARERRAPRRKTEAAWA